MNTTFITPFDREDLRSLASDLDDIVDHLESVAKYLVLFELAEAPEPLRRFAEILFAMAVEIDTLRMLIWDMGNLPEIQEAMVRISELENQGDSLYFTVIADLFRKGRGDVDRDPEVEGSLRGPRGGLRPLQGLHARRRQRRHQERLSHGDADRCLPLSSSSSSSRSSSTS